MQTISVLVRNRKTHIFGYFPQKAFQDYFSFYVPNYRFMPLFKQGRWDGRVKLIKNGMVATGLFLALYRELEEKLNLKFKIEYEITKPQFLPNVDSDRPYQIECVRKMQEACNHGGGLILAATGVGKTRMTGLLFKSLVGSACFVVDELTLMKQALEELTKIVGEPIGHIGHSEFNPKRITVVTIQTLHKHKDKPHFKEWAKSLKLMVVDECFPAETKVITHLGIIDIGTIVNGKLSLKVLSKNTDTQKLEWRQITRWVKNPLESKLVTVYHGTGHFECTSNHPIWVTGKGYVRADELEVGMDLETVCPMPQEVLFSLRKTKQKQEVLQSQMQRFIQTLSTPIKSMRILWKKLLDTAFRKKEQSKKKILWNDLQSKIHIPTSARSQTPSRSGASQLSQIIGFSYKRVATTRIPSYEKTKPYDDACLHSQSPKFSKEEQHVRCLETQSRRKRSGATATTKTTVKTVGEEMDFRTGNLFREKKSWVSNLLQSRLKPSNQETSGGNRWEQPQTPQASRQEKRFETSISRVERVEIHKSRSIKRYKNSSKENSFVYCLEVEGNHNFFADNVLVSNCHLAINRRQTSTLTALQPPAVLGLTATLALKERHVQLQAFAIAGPVAFRYSLKTGEEEGYLTKGIVVQVKVEHLFSKTRDQLEWTDQYYQDVVYNRKRNDAVEQLARLAWQEGRSVVVLAEWLPHLKDLSQRLHDIPHYVISGQIDVDDRVKAKQKFNKGQVRLIITNKVFKKGIDIPKLDCIIDAAGMKSRTDCIQKYGRGARLCPGKEGLLYFDIGDKGSYFLEATCKVRSEEFRRNHIPVFTTTYSTKRAPSIVDKAIAKTKRLVQGG